MLNSRSIIAFALLISFCAVSPAQGANGLDDYQLSVWQSKEFKRKIVQSFLAISDLEPTWTEREERSLRDLYALIQEDKLDEAVKLAERMQQDNAASAVFDYQLGNIWFTREAYDRAVFEFKKAIEKHDRYLQAHKRLGMCYIRLEKFELAIDELTRTVELGGGDGIVFGLLGFAYANIGDYIAAESAFRMANLLDPKTKDWKLGLAQAFFKQQRFADAASLVGAMIRKEPNNPKLWILQGNAYMGVGKTEDAAENFEIADQLGGSTVESLMLLADIYLKDGLFDIAVETYGRALDKGGEVVVDRATRAVAILTSRQQYDEAKQLLASIDTKHGQTFTPEKRKEVLKLQARIAVAEGAGDEEAAILQQVVDIDPMDGEALILLGQYHGRQDNVEQAVFMFERAASIEEFEAEAKKRHGQLLVKNKKFKEAVPLLRASLNIEPQESLRRYLEQVELLARTGS